MNVFQRSWAVTKQSFGVMHQDKEIFLFPILSTILSIILFGLFVLPSIIVGLSASAQATSGMVLNYTLWFVYYLLLILIATYFNVATTYTAKRRFEGQNATFTEALSFAAGRISYIFKWSIVAAIVGLILKAIENMGRKANGIGALGVSIVRFLLGAAWSIATIFVIPILAFENVGPFTAIGKSWDAFKKTWGENAVLYFGTGFIQGLLTFLVFVPTVGLVVLGFFNQNIALVLISIAIFIVLITIIGLFFSVANTIFRTALYIYASTGKTPSSFDPEILKSAARKL